MTLVPRAESTSVDSGAPADRRPGRPRRADRPLPPHPLRRQARLPGQHPAPLRRAQSVTTVEYVAQNGKKLTQKVTTKTACGEAKTQDEGAATTSARSGGDAGSRSETVRSALTYANVIATIALFLCARRRRRSRRPARQELGRLTPAEGEGGDHRQDRQQRGQRRQGRQRLADRRRHQPRRPRHRPHRDHRRHRRQRQHGRRPRRRLPGGHDPDPRHSASTPPPTRSSPTSEAAADACAAKGGYLPTPLELYSTRAVLNLGTGVGQRTHSTPTPTTQRSTPARTTRRSSSTAPGRITEQSAIDRRRSTSASTRSFARRMMRTIGTEARRSAAALGSRARGRAGARRPSGRSTQVEGNLHVSFNGSISPSKLPRTARRRSGCRWAARSRPPTDRRRRNSNRSSSKSTATGSCRPRACRPARWQAATRSPPAARRGPAAMR